LFTDFRADEFFTIHAGGKVDRTVKNGCYQLDEWNDPRNRSNSPCSSCLTASGKID
jgi:hypothetical protein